MESKSPTNELAAEASAAAASAQTDLVYSDRFYAGCAEQIELAFVASVLFKNYDLLPEFALIVQPGDFLFKECARLYRYLLNAHKNERGCPSIEIARTELGIDNESFWYNLHLQNTFINAFAHAKSIKNRAMKRQLGQLCYESLALLNDELLDGDEFAKDFHNKLIKIIENKAVLSIKDTKASALEFVDAYKFAQSRRGGLLGLSFSIDGLDAVTSGAKSGELIIIAARPGCGKTTLALSIAAKALSCDKSVLFFSLEMQASNLYAKMISHLGGLEIGADEANR